MITIGILKFYKINAGFLFFMMNGHVKWYTFSFLFACSDGTLRYFHKSTDTCKICRI